MKEKTLLYIDCCIRGKESRTGKIGEAFLEALPPAYALKRLVLTEEPLCPLTGGFFAQRQQLLEEGELSHRRFSYAREFAAADRIVIAAPFWDLGFPALLKIYIENVSLDGITFTCDEQGLKGMCRAKKMIFLTSRGGFYNGSPDEMGARYLEALSRFFGIGEFICIAADGLDMDVNKAPGILAKACEKAAALAAKL